MTSTLHYFPILGRGEPIRMTLAACNAQYEEAKVDFGSMKDEAGTAASPFGQAPYLDTPEGVRLSQMTAIMKYVAAKHKPLLLGGSEVERAQVDMLLLGIDDLYLKYISCVYQKSLFEEGKVELWKDHFEPESKSARNGGAHLFFLVEALARGKGSFFLGAQPSIADVFFYFALEAFNREQCFGDKLLSQYPSLGPYMAAVAGIDGLAGRLSNPERQVMPFNGNGQG
ncbi:unnamed protein product [Polarella glacialis]|uniref:glutathione transferase n=1 Tax=Polarella glacialis TaxID=89957 RepID=A0A813HUA5_POLGL|nr:unnamed protein product [Polarella glacialis]CAE8735421.1 unnamed protein product [Polarella glacialis]